MITRFGGAHRYSDVVIHNNVAYLSGIVPTDLSNNIFGQTSEVLNILDNTLKSINSSKDNILSMTIYLKDASLYEDVNVIYDKWIYNSPPPARATIGIVTFPNPRWLIEIVVTAALPSLPTFTCYYDISSNYLDISSNYLDISSNYLDISSNNVSTSSFYDSNVSTSSFYDSNVSTSSFYDSNVSTSSSYVNSSSFSNYVSTINNNVNYII
jgi:enamine deaminase RidA (YjgF/YER057c/UK114 family)